MSTYFNEQLNALKATPKQWLITGCAGFIGSNLLEALLRAGQTVRGLDNFATGYQANLDDVYRVVGPDAWQNFEFINGDITDLQTCQRACENIDYVLHQAALGSVPRSIAAPINSHEANVNGFLNMLIASRDQKIQRLVYASSSSVYGDHPDLPKIEDRVGTPLSPYAATKAVNELYATVYANTYGVSCIGLRYFNVFGARQNVNGPYAAVIPRWIQNLMAGESGLINGDGETSRDFCYVQNAVQANILAAITPHAGKPHEVFNVAFRQQTSLKDLYMLISDIVAELSPGLAPEQPQMGPFRQGDVRHSLADIDKIKSMLGYSPTHDIRAGLAETVPWYLMKQSQGTTLSPRAPQGLAAE
jgi:UDP-N-acetylglucosamine 4-epimerase